MKAPLQGLSWPALLTASVSQERKKMEEIMAGLQRRHENEVADLHASVERLLKVGCGFFFLVFFSYFTDSCLLCTPMMFSSNIQKEKKASVSEKQHTSSCRMSSCCCFLGKCDGPCRQIKSAHYLSSTNDSISRKCQDFA